MMMLGDEFECVASGMSREEDQLFQRHAGYFTSFAGVLVCARDAYAELYTTYNAWVTLITDHVQVRPR